MSHGEVQRIQMATAEAVPRSVALGFAFAISLQSGCANWAASESSLQLPVQEPLALLRRLQVSAPLVL